MASTGDNADVACDDIATQKINELNQKMKNNFSDEEVQKFISMGKTLASKSVLSLLIKTIEEGPVKKGFSKEECDRLVKKITLRMPYNYSGYVTCAFKEFPHLLHITLSIVDKDYKTCIDIPHESYARDLFEKYDFLKNTARAYWKQFCEEESELFDRVCRYRSDIDFSDLVIDPTNPTSLYFDEAAIFRISIFCYYTLNGKPLYKKTK